MEVIQADSSQYSGCNPSSEAFTEQCCNHAQSQEGCIRAVCSDMCAASLDSKQAVCSDMCPASLESEQAGDTQARGSPKDKQREAKRQREETPAAAQCIGSCPTAGISSLTSTPSARHSASHLVSPRNAAKWIGCGEYGPRSPSPPDRACLILSTNPSNTSPWSATASSMRISLFRMFVLFSFGQSVRF